MKSIKLVVTGIAIAMCVLLAASKNTTDTIHGQPHNKTNVQAATTVQNAGDAELSVHGFFIPMRMSRY